MSPVTVYRMLTAAIDRWRDTLSLVFVWLLGGRLSLEARSIRAGHGEYGRRARHKNRSFSGLRRAIHRLEKGLTMRPRASIFALDYIDEAVDFYVTAMASNNGEPGELRWAHDVLQLYFATVDSHPRIDSARAKFAETMPTVEVGAGATGHVPYEYSNLPPVSVGYSDLMALVRHRKSVRWFLEREVPLEFLHMALDAALQAPSACNRQPFLWRVVNSAERAKRVAEIAMGTVGYAHNIPCVVVVLGDFGAFEHSRDRHVPYIDASLAAMQFMLALETLGLASCPINWPDIAKLERRMGAELGLPPHVRPVMLIAVGYADPLGLVAYSERRTSSAVMRLTDDYRP